MQGPWPELWKAKQDTYGGITWGGICGSGPVFRGEGYLSEVTEVLGSSWV